MSLPHNHIVTVLPPRRQDCTRHPNKFDVHYRGEFVFSSETPFFDAARWLLDNGLARPENKIAMRHAGRHYDALTASVGYAAKLMIAEEPSRTIRARRYRKRRFVGAFSPGLSKAGETVSSLPRSIDGGSAL